VTEDLHRQHASFLWDLCYRMTGNAADADDIVQETLVRALASPPARTDEPWRPWLVRVATNLARDHLRKRKRVAYTGPWLPSPIETGEARDEGDQESRYGMVESVTFAFLLAVEVLRPRQRAVLLLRDVFDFTVEETARALGITEENVRTTHHRARVALAAYDRERCVPTLEAQAKARGALERLMAAVGTQDVARIAEVLDEAARLLTDGGGHYRAALNPIVGHDRVARFLLGIQRFVEGTPIVAERMLNGFPALVVDLPDATPPNAPRLVIRCDLERHGRIVALHLVLAPRKLSALTEGRGQSDRQHDKIS
jgi:RNA polymerase sigma-70 factor, ECF subfamily